MKINNAKVFLFICTVLISTVFISCSSSTETEKKEDDIRYKEVEKKEIKNIDAVERAYISSSKINSIEKISFNLDSEGKPAGSEKLSTLNYNEKGFLTETIIYDDGEIRYRFTYDYDKVGKRIKTSRFIDGTLENYYTYEYNKYGNKLNVSRYNLNDNLEEYYLYEYDDEGNLTEEDWYSSDGKKIYSIENDYDNGRKTSSSTYDENGNLIYKYVFRYDDKDNVIEEIKYDNSGDKTGLIQYIYKYF